MVEPTELQRRHELAKLTRVELIDYIINFQNAVEPLIVSIDAAYGDEP